MTVLVGPGKTWNRCTKLNCTTPPSDTQVPLRSGGRYMSDCASSGAPAARASRANHTCLVTGPPWRETCAIQFRIPHSALRIRLPPFLHPFVVQHGGHLSLRQHLDPERVAVRLAIEPVGHARVDDEFGAHDARGRADEHDLVAYAARSLDQRIHLGVNTTAVARDRGVAS